MLLLKDPGGPWVLWPPPPDPTPVGRERCPASFRDTFWVTQRHVFLMAIREQHRYGTMPGHQHSQAHPTPPEPPGKHRMGCPGREGQGWRSPVVVQVPSSGTGHHGQPQGTGLSGLFEGHWGTGLGWSKAWPRGTYPGDSLAGELTYIFHRPLHTQWPI